MINQLMTCFLFILVCAFIIEPSWSQENLGDQALHNSATVDPEKFDRFLKRISENKADTPEKIKLLKSIAAGGSEVSQTAYLLYYNAEATPVGYPHLKMVVNGKVYEIHRIPNKDGTFLYERDLYKGLLERKGYLPSGIVSFPISAEQSEGVVSFLKNEASSSMKYAFFNKLFSKDTYNCGGILYEALRRVGYDLPPMTKFNSFLPGMLFRQAYKNVPEAKLVGIGKTWREDLVKPNLTLRTIPQPLSGKKSCISRALQRLLK